MVRGERRSLAQVLNLAPAFPIYKQAILIGSSGRAVCTTQGNELNVIASSDPAVL